MSTLSLSSSKMFSKSSIRFKLPVSVVIPSVATKFKSSFGSSSSTSSSSSSLHKQQEDDRVMKLAVRVNNVLESLQRNETAQKEVQEGESFEFDFGTRNQERGETATFENPVAAELAIAQKILRDAQPSTTSPSSSSQQQRSAMIEFLKMQQNEKQQAFPSEPKGKSFLKQLRDGEAKMLNENEQKQLTDYLDSFVDRTNERFEEKKKEDFAQEATEIKAKNQRFAHSLHRFSQFLKDECDLSVENEDWFLACGTALGCQREGNFIAHDNDIDIGILYDDSIHDKILKLIQKTAPVSVGIEAALWQRQQQQQQQHENSTPFVCFETLGKLFFGGFELRLMDVSTGVMIDVNIYYTSQRNTKTGEFLLAPSSKQQNENLEKNYYMWFGSFYEDSAKRKHGMYRYHFSSPIAFEMKEFPAGSGMSYVCPTEKYLNEYFGNDWSVPKIYSYEEGVKNKHYKNIIEE